MKLTLDILITLSTAISGFYWYMSATVLIPPGTGKEGDVEIICNGDGSVPPWEVVGTLREQSIFNTKAAFWAVITATLAIASLAVQNIT